MRLNLVIIEPKSYPYGHFLDDGVRLIQYGLESLGHDVTLQFNKLETDRINVVWGMHYFRKPQDVETIASAGPYIAVQSEVVHATGLGFANDPNMMRDVYMPFMRGALAVWDAKPACLAKLRQMGLRAFQVPLGYHPRLEEVHHKSHKDVDFSFFGSVTPHRKMLFDAIIQRGHRIEVMFDARKMFRDDLVARTRVHLAPTQSADFNQLSLQRVCYLLNNRGLCVVEHCPDQGPLEHCFESAVTEQWVDLAINTLHRSDREQLAEIYFQRYQRIRMEDGLERLLEQTFSSGQFAAASGEPHGMAAGTLRVPFATPGCNE